VLDGSFPQPNEKYLGLSLLGATIGKLLKSINFNFRLYYLID